MPKIYFQKMTPNGYKQIEDEIEQLKLDRPAKIKQLQEARALGDLSENAEYSAAKRDLRHLESRLNQSKDPKPVHGGIRHLEIKLTT